MAANDPVDLLLVEDSPVDAELLTRVLREQCLTARVHVVHDGEEALAFLFRRGRHAQRAADPLPRCVLLDLKLPKIGGLDVLAAIRADARTAALPVVVLSSSAEDGDLAEAYRRGANSYVVKPLGYDALRTALGRLGAYWLLVNRPCRPA